MKDLQQVYEAILGKKLRRTTFQRKMMSLDILKRHGKFYSGSAIKRRICIVLKSDLPID
jgi:hypothetical protein